MYNLNPTIYLNKRDNTIQLVYYSKALLEFKKNFGLCVGKKDNVEIPKSILDSDYILDFIRGLFDTDGCLHFQKKYKEVNYYPRLDITSKSKKLISQTDEILRNHGFTTSACFNNKSIASNGTQCTTHRVFIYGLKNLRRWVELIGFSNPKNIKKFNEWKKEGHYSL